MSIGPIPGRLSRIAAVLALAFGLATPAALAETEFSNQQLDAFASAVVEVNPLIEQWNKKIQSAKSEEKAKQMSQQARGEVVSTIESNGLEVDTYNKIVQAAQNDPALRKEIQGRIKQQ